MPTYYSPIINVKINDEKKINVKFENVVAGSGNIYPPYTGETEVTPTQSTQILNTSGQRLDSDIIVNPIPSNYGLITWNGSFITVS